MAKSKGNRSAPYCVLRRIYGPPPRPQQRPVAQLQQQVGAAQQLLQQCAPGPMRLRNGKVLAQPAPPPPAQFGVGQCFALTTKGTTCLRRQKANCIYCWQHQKMHEDGKLPIVPPNPALQPRVDLIRLPDPHSEADDQEPTASQNQPEAGTSNQSNSSGKATAVTIEDILQKEGREFTTITGDGNCFFRSLSLQIMGTQEEYKFFRALIVNFIREHIRTFSEWFMPKDINVEAYLDHMAENETYATECEIAAAATLFRKDFFILWRDTHGNYRWVGVPPIADIKSTQHPFGRQDPCYITLTNRGLNHFELIRPEGRSCNCNFPPPVSM